ncbi:T9SS type A sorting domain-containing protein [Pontibacter sp. G13]|uniref:T9SS type A sorting domain-containing protein n=1 Tax=Pontibacter sp. G13 TaxID=3074898 RepID=UPI0028899BA9|nr:T9SS type A sorting domain-containing protein [Pontibacter sp. G13]WNJ17119.1 T9SS type A sorting domain-containing protein [Pontibacter sp. G13]
MKKTILLFITFYSFSSFAQDWVGIPVPADPGTGNEWVLEDNFSDDFNYSAPAENKGTTFRAKWDDFYHNAWQGPGLTTWERNHSMVEGGELKLIATRYLSNRVNAGAVHSEGVIGYPVYVEIRAKIMNSVLANGGWMLSPDDTQEIDFMEAYGSSQCNNCPPNEQDQSWFAQRMHMSHHVFIRNPFSDWQPSEFGSNTGNPAPSPTWITRNDGSGNIYWKDDYHRYGVYWQDPTHLYYYIDGVLVTQRVGMERIDPVHYTNADLADAGNTSVDTRTGLNKDMHILFTVEDQDWRSNNAVTPTDAELSNTDDHTLNIDWIRVYKPQSTTAIDEEFARNLQIFPNPFNDQIQLRANVQLKRVEVYTVDGNKVWEEDGIQRSNHTISTDHLSAGLYFIKIEHVDGGWAFKKVIKE